MTTLASRIELHVLGKKAYRAFFSPGRYQFRPADLVILESGNNYRLPFEGGEKTSAAAQPDRVYEQHQAQQVDDLRQLHLRIQRAKKQSHEQHRRHAQAEAANLDTPDEVAQRRHDEQQQQRILQQ